MMESIINIIKRYRLYGSIRLCTDLVFTKLIFPQAKLLRRPFYIRYENKIKMGRGFVSGPGLIIDVYGKSSRLVIGDDVLVNHGVHIGVAEEVFIGDRVLIASGVYISDHSHGTYSGGNQSSPLEPPNQRKLVSKPVSIGADTWIGEKAAILPGVCVGEGVIIGAGAVVTKSIPSFSIVAGIPAKVIKKYNFESKQWEVVTDE